VKAIRHLLLCSLLHVTEILLLDHASYYSFDHAWKEGCFALSDGRNSAFPDLKFTPMNELV